MKLNGYKPELMFLKNVVKKVQIQKQVQILDQKIYIFFIIYSLLNIVFYGIYPISGDTNCKIENKSILSKNIVYLRLYLLVINTFSGVFLNSCHFNLRFSITSYYPVLKETILLSVSGLTFRGEAASPPLVMND